ncbi:MAG: V-type ATPase 116kDa subunit family protein [Pseudomonadota bacterium]|nr:V-type ATPase 116kDa subunit family protein [Pseudomonadota bacterium]
MWRPARMEWLDIMVDRASAGPVLDALADSRALELVEHPREQRCAVAAEQVDELNVLEASLKPYRACLPEPDPGVLSAGELSAPMEESLPSMTRMIEHWVAEAGPWCEQLKELDEVLEEWRLLAQCLRRLPDDGIDLARFHSGKSYRALLGVGPAETVADIPQHEGEELVRTYPMADDGDEMPGTQLEVILGVAHVDRLQPLERLLRSGGMRFLGVPAVLRGPPSQAVEMLEKLIAGREEDREQYRQRVFRLAEETQLAAWRWQLRRYLWFADLMQQAWCNERFLWICGWCPAPKRPRLEAALRRTGASYLIRTEDVAGHGAPPVVLDNPGWLQQFEVFVRGYGVPGQNQLDPTPVLAVVTPLLFGYMFGDVGHGLVFLLAGLVLRRRYPLFRLLVPAGVSSMLFGLLFGSVFCIEQRIPALWLHPMDEPLTVLAVPLVFGGVLLLGSMVLAGIQARWSGTLREWAGTQMPQILLVLALAASFVDRRLAAALLAAMVGMAVAFPQPGRRPAGMVKNLLLLLENGFQLLINVLSFVRVGAFALAHAGLGIAVIGLAAIPDNAFLQLVILVLGNVVVIGLEGLVVSIQTTRLVMFEFFRRFLEGQGRSFNPLQPPGAVGSSNH